MGVEEYQELFMPLRGTTVDENRAEERKSGRAEEDMSSILPFIHSSTLYFQGRRREDNG
jgi:hypothetical protein